MTRNASHRERNAGYRAAVGVLLSAWLVSCATPPEESQTAEVTPTGITRIAAGTKLPSTFDKSLGDQDPHRRVVLPAGLLHVSRVSRPRAEVRLGPGTQFPLADTLLTSGTRVLLYQRIGVWQQVIIPESELKGWVHFRTLGTSEPNKNAITIRANALPTVLALQDIEAIFAYPSKQPLKVSIPRGALFRSLAVSKFGTLVWLAGTDTVAWVAGKDAQ